MEQASLLAGVGFDLQRCVVLPGDVQTSGNSHDGGRAVGFALEAGGFILGGIPGIDHLAGFGIGRNAGGVALERRHHAPAPVFGNISDPVSSEIDRRARLSRRGSGRRARRTELREESARGGEYQRSAVWISF